MANWFLYRLDCDHLVPSAEAASFQGWPLFCPSCREDRIVKSREMEIPFAPGL